MKVLLVMILIVISFCVGGNEIALAQTASQKFFNPTLSTRSDGSSTLPFNIAGCVDSDRFSNVCGDDARRVIASEACKLKGFPNWVSYEVTDLGWKNRKEQWVWQDKDRGDGSFIIDVSSFMFTSLECSNKPPVGYFDNGATVFYSDGSSYCGFRNPSHLSSFRRVKPAPSLGRRNPSSFGTYTGACPSLGE